MNLTIDAGNTRTKVVLFDGDQVIARRNYKTFGPGEIRSILRRYDVTYSILSSVVKTPASTRKLLKRGSHFIELKPGIGLPVKNLYRTPGTLGNDRLASVIGAGAVFPGKNVLVIDAGTCIKYDLINTRKEYRGGSISPGLNMRFRALHQYTDKLPLVQPEQMQGFVGRTTKESILTGVQTGILNEMEGFIRLYRKKYPSLKIILTGGDAARFARPLNLSIFAPAELVNIGLHAILLHHVATSKA